MKWRLYLSVPCILIGCGLLAAIIFATLPKGGDAANTLRVYDQSGAAPEREEDFPVSGTGGIPDITAGFAPVASGITPSRSDGRSIAVLATLPVGVTEQAILAPPFIPNDDPNFIGYKLATVRYGVGGNDLYVSTLQPANLGLQRPLNLGRLHGDIGKGRQAYVTSGVLREGTGLATRRTFNQVSFVENGLVIVISSELPIDRLFGFAKDISLTSQR